MGDFGEVLSRLTGLVFPLLWGVCAVAAIIKFRGTPARVLAGIGFGIICLNGVVQHLTVFRFGYSSMAQVVVLGLPFAVGVTLVVVGIFCLRTGEAGDAPPLPGPYYVAQPYQPAGYQAAYPPPMYQAPMYQAPPVAGGPVQIMPPRRRPGWGLLITWLALSPLCALLGIVALALIADSGSYMSDSELAGVLTVLALDFVLLIPTAITYLMWVYQSWDAVPPQFRTVTPGQAIGFMFIPIFNIYWIFRVVPGLSTAIKRTREAVTGRQAGGAGYGVGIAACIVVIIPWVGMLSWPLFAIWAILANIERNTMLRELWAASQQIQTQAQNQ